MKAVGGMGTGTSTVSERVVYTVVSYLSLAVSANLLLYAIMNNFRYDCAA